MTAAFRVPTSPSPAVVIRGQPTIIMAARGGGLRARSLREPDALVVDVGRHRLARDGIVVEANRLIVAFVVALAARPASFVATSELVEQIYGHAPDGGPTCTDQSLSSLADRAGPTLAALGYRVETERFRGRWLRCCLSPLDRQEPDHG